jgi:hypothetical protein
MNQAQKIADTLPYYGRKELIVDDHDTHDIIRAIKRAHKRYQRDYDRDCEEFWADNAKDTARRLFDFTKQYITYDVEHPDNQSVKSPGAIIAQRHGDCKHYAALINGYADALQRKGYPIHCKYRFVADGPDREVHHVFAVIMDGNNEYWADPVLKHFNEQPIFHNEKDVSMGALYSISGLAPYPHGLPMVGKAKKKKSNPFKKLAQGLKTDVKKAGKGVENVAKGAVKDVKKAANLVLNVAETPARNAFLALLDLNLFNLATRMAEALKSHHNEVLAEWKKINGNQQKLVNAINNGLKHKASDHHQAPAKRVSGTIEDVLDGRVHHRQPDNRLRVHQVPTLMHAYRMGPDEHGRLPRVAGIGDPVSATTLTALATAIIAAFEKYMKPAPASQQGAVHAAKEGVASLVANASDAIEAGHTKKGKKLLDDATQGAQAIDMAAGEDDEGTPTLAINSFNHPQLNNAGAPGGPDIDTGPAAPGTGPGGAAPDATDDDDDDAPTPSDKLTHDVTALPAKITSDVAGDIKDKLRELWEDYKTPIVFAAVGIIAYKFATRKKKRGR